MYLLKEYLAATPVSNTPARKEPVAVPRSLSRSVINRPLTVKLGGRPRAPDQAPQPHKAFSACASDVQPVHGPPQRLLDAESRRPCARIARTGSTMASGSAVAAIAMETCPPRTG